MRQEKMEFWDAVASAGPYANTLHLAPDRYLHLHLIVHVLVGVQWLCFIAECVVEAALLCVLMVGPRCVTGVCSGC